MNSLQDKRTLGYPMSGGCAAFIAGGEAWTNAAHEQRGRRAGLDVVRTQTVITDVPGRLSALSFVRRA
ncbi:hypothetical protein [Actinophytocola sp.]|uniref:hypothetical protein n=1 Tax=Actinophytocola sp. TaxID=1872138 RepID=UPI002D7E481F|nr:hypothetical protein [Actinophytocola sp.]HET9138015.1 hypothetical protein [Actinophytocola sp.]